MELNTKLVSPSKGIRCAKNVDSHLPPSCHRFHCLTHESSVVAIWLYICLESRDRPTCTDFNISTTYLGRFKNDWRKISKSILSQSYDSVWQDTYNLHFKMRNSAFYRSVNFSSKIFSMVLRSKVVCHRLILILRDNWNDTTFIGRVHNVSHFSVIKETFWSGGSRNCQYKVRLDTEVTLY